MEFLLQDLQPDSCYEAKVSYLATQPTSFAFRLSNNQFHHSERDLLNVEKSVICTDLNGVPSGGSTLQISLVHAGISVNPNHSTEPVLFNIYLDPLLYGAIPSVSLPLIMTVVAALVILAVILTWAWKSHLLERIFLV